MAKQPDLLTPTMSARGDEDPASPNTLVFNYIRSQGLVPNAQNVRAAVTRLGMQGGEDLANTPSNTLRIQGGGSVADKIEGGGQQGNAGSPDDNKQRPVDTTVNQSRQDAEASSYQQSQGGKGGSPSTSAQPSSDVLGTAILAGSPLVMDWLSNREGNTFRNPMPGEPGADFMGNQPMAPTGRMMDVPGAEVGGPPSTLQLGGQPSSGLPAPQGVIGGPQGPVSPMEMAMQKALASAGPPQLGIPGPQPAPPIAMPDATSGPPIPMQAPMPPPTVGGGAAGTPQGRPTVTIDTNPQLSGMPSPINPQMLRPGQPSVTIQTNPRLSGRPPPIDFAGMLNRLGRSIR